LKVEDGKSFTGVINVISNKGFNSIELVLHSGVRMKIVPFNESSDLYGDYDSKNKLLLYKNEQALNLICEMRPELPIIYFTITNSKPAIKTELFFESQNLGHQLEA
jgi:hypothetical protein